MAPQKSKRKYGPGQIKLDMYEAWDCEISEVKITSKILFGSEETVKW